MYGWVIVEVDKDAKIVAVIYDTSLWPHEEAPLAVIRFNLQLQWLASDFCRSRLTSSSSRGHLGAPQE
jgi:hypothetical protein